ncbi:MAG: winged helix-turn-helix transcriptional regulator [Pseudomonadota bacterium]
MLASMGEGVAGRQAPLIHATGAGRTAFRQTLDHLIELGLVERNPGHGHPLRPEFRLTEEGQAAAQMALRVRAILQDDAGWDLARKAWTLPVLRATLEPARFTDIRRQLVPITDRALSQSLVRLEASNWMLRDVDVQARPARALYEATGQGRTISELLAA